MYVDTCFREVQPSLSTSYQRQVTYTPPHPTPPHPNPPSTTLHNALICLQKRASYNNIAFQNINTCDPRPRGETGLILRSEKSLLLVMKNAHRTSGTGVLWQRRLCLSNYKSESFTTRRLLGTEERKIEVWWRQVTEVEIWGQRGRFYWWRNKYRQ
jgi:hypothetical protein